MSNQELGLGVLIAAAAIVIGYLVRCVVPSKHYPRTFGVITANAIVGGLASVGIKIAGDMILGFLIWSGIVFMFTAMIDHESKDT